MHRTVERLRKFPADADWMVGILYTINPDHHIFAQGYSAPRKATVVAEKKPELDAAFFAGLPISKSKKKLTCTLGAPRLSKTERERLRIAKLEEKLAVQQKVIAFQIQRSKERIADQEKIDSLLEKVRLLENEGSKTQQKTSETLSQGAGTHGKAAGYA